MNFEKLKYTDSNRQTKNENYSGVYKTRITMKKFKSVKKIQKHTYSRYLFIEKIESKNIKLCLSHLFR